MSSISDLMLEVSHVENMTSPDIRTLISQAHRRIFDVIHKQDAEAARHCAERDVQAHAKYLEAAVMAVSLEMK